MIYKSKIDAWLGLIILIVPAVTIITIIVEGISQTNLLALALMVLASLLTIWLMLATDYRFKDDKLVVRSGPFNWKIQLSDITHVKESRELIASPALSLDRLRIEYKGTFGAILISPENKQGFIAELESRRASSA